MKHFRQLSFYVVLFVVLLFIVVYLSRTDTPNIDFNYSKMISAINDDRVNSITINGSNAFVEIKGDSSRQYQVFIPDMQTFMVDISDAL